MDAVGSDAEGYRYTGIEFHIFTSIQTSVQRKFSLLVLSTKIHYFRMLNRLTARYSSLQNRSF